MADDTAGTGDRRPFCKYRIRSNLITFDILALWTALELKFNVFRTTKRRKKKKKKKKKLMSEIPTITDQSWVSFSVNKYFFYVMSHLEKGLSFFWCL